MEITTTRNIKPNYKKTPVGIIPEDWEVKTYLDISDKITDGTHDTPKKVQEGFPYLTAIHIENGKIDYDNAYYLLEEDHKKIYARCNPEFGDLLMVNIGAGVGNIAMNIADYEFSLKNVALIKINNKIAESEFVEYYGIFYRPRLINSLLNGGAQPFLGLKDIKKLQLALPPLPEQKAIADCLSTWDKAIEKQTQLINAKKEFKKGLMQGLFNGQLSIINDQLVRAKGGQDFTKDWEEVKLGDIANIKKGKQLNRKKLNDYDKYPSYSGGITPSGYTDKSNCKSNTIIISEGGNSCGYVNFIEKDFWLGGHCYAVNENKNKVIKGFLYNVLKFRQPKIMILRVGSGLPNVQKGDLEKFKIRIPNLKIQKTIAQILQSADQEIELLEKKLEQLQKQKKGLMQVLLTGEKRLV